MIRFYDSALKAKIGFVPLHEGKLSIYVCGPTVYDVAHLGHGRSAVAFDLIRRYFQYSGFVVKFVSNYTDIDDKMIKRANEEKISVSALAERIIPEYKDDYASLNVLPPDDQPKATDYVEVIVDLIKRLETKGFTYVLDDGVYFDVSRFKAYGDFSGQNLEELKMGARVEVDEAKRNPYDFVLWKFKKDAEPFWGSPWGDGRPGWHIECSAMTYANLGEKFDIHGGGLDLKFPHHECEVAQSKACFGDGSFAQHWLHNGFIQVDNEKMSKSLGNFFTLKEIFEKYDPIVVRFMFFQTHYRNPINFSQVLLDQAKAALGRIHDFVNNLQNFLTDEVFTPDVSGNVAEVVDLARATFVKAMDDDFETSEAMAAIFTLMRDVNKLFADDILSKADARFVLDFLKEVDQVLAVIFVKKSYLDADLRLLIGQREEARRSKDFEMSDALRDELLKKGVLLEDTPNGTVWKLL